MNLVFFGSSQFSNVVLEKVLSTKYKVLSVVTTPNKPSGRGLKIKHNPVKLLAQQHHIPVFTDVHQLLNTKLPPQTIGLVAAHGRILGPKTLSKFSNQVYVIHPSLLPKYRGPSPLQQQIQDGIVETGVTIIQADLGEDTGPVVAVEKDTIHPSDTWINLGNRLFVKGAELFLSLALSTEPLALEPQKDSEATYTHKLSRQDGFLPYDVFMLEIEKFRNYLKIGNWKLKISRMHRAYAGWPGIWTTDPSGRRLKLVSLNPITTQVEGKNPKVDPALSNN